MRIALILFLSASIARGAGMAGYPCYRTVAETYAALTNLVTVYPTLAAWTNVGTSFQGRTMLGVVLTSPANAASKCGPVVFTAAEHGCELGTSEMLTQLAEEACREYATNAFWHYALDWGQIQIVPFINIDGRTACDSSYSTDYRKNRHDEASCGGLTGGVDLNRNFPAAWGIGNADPCSSTYRGTNIASEAETQSLTNYLTRTFAGRGGHGATAEGLLIDFHTNTGETLYPWYYSDDAAEDKTALLTLGRKLSYFNENEVYQHENDTYKYSGTMSDWAYSNAIPVLVIELLGPTYALGCATFTNDLAIYLPSVRYAITAGRRPYSEPAGPEVLTLSASATGTTLSVTATANDTRTGGDATNQVSAAVYTIDTPSWAGGTTNAVTVSNASGGTADLSASVNISALSVGQHVLYVESLDDSGNWGVPTAAFFDRQADGTAVKLSGSATISGNVRMQ